MERVRSCGLVRCQLTGRSLAIRSWPNKSHPCVTESFGAALFWKITRCDFNKAKFAFFFTNQWIYWLKIDDVVLNYQFVRCEVEHWRTKWGGSPDTWIACWSPWFLDCITVICFRIFVCRLFYLVCFTPAEKDHNRGASHTRTSRVPIERDRERKDWWCLIVPLSAARQTRSSSLPILLGLDFRFSFSSGMTRLPARRRLCGSFCRWSGRS